MKRMEGQEDDWSEAKRIEGKKIIENLAVTGQRLLRAEAVGWWDNYLNGVKEQ